MMGRGALLTLAGQWSKYAVQLLTLVVYSRLLAPGDFGVVAMVTAVVGIAYVIGDFGLSLAALQAEELTRVQRANLFWLNAALGLGLGVVVALSGPLLASLFDDERVAGLAPVLAGVFLCNGLSTQFRVHINRQLRFGYLAAVEVLSQLGGFGIGLMAIAAGMGYWALVLLQLSAAVLALILFAAGSGWLPGRPGRAPMGPLLSFGAYTFATQVTNYLSRNVDAILIGRAYGAAPLGYYNRAQQISAVPVQQLAAPVTKVALPHLSRRRGDRTAYGELVVQYQRFICYSLLTLLSIAFAAAEPLVRIVLGPDWDPAVPLLRVLCLAAAFQAMGYVYYWVLLSQARTALLFWSELGGRVAMIALTVVAVPHGPVWIAAAVAAGQLILLLTGAAFAVPRAGLSAGQILAPALRAFTAAAVLAAAVVLVGDRLPDLAPAASLVALVLVWLALAGVFLVAPAYRRDGTAGLSLLRSAVGRAAAS